MQQPFVQFLLERGLVPESVAERLNHRQFIREPLGVIAVGHGLLTVTQIDEVLDRQRGSRDRFGEIAVDMGLLTSQQVDMLVAIQEFRVSSAIAEALALSDVLSIGDAARHLGGFLTRGCEVQAVMAES